MTSTRTDSHERYVHGMERLVSAVSDLSLARDVDTVRDIVRTAARQLTGADGATFILREGECCSYVDEDAIGPLWKGKRFPMSACISGWSMLHRESVVLEDIYSDPRIPAEAYRPTFVKSLVMVPIRAASPIGAIGNYWATPHRAEPHEVKLLQALADSTAIALENVQIHRTLEARVRERTDQLEIANAELESFAYSVSHDLRGPLIAIKEFANLLQGHAAALPEEGQLWLQHIAKSATRMDALIKDFMDLSHVSREPAAREEVDLSSMVREILDDLHGRSPGRHVLVQVADGVKAACDQRLVRIALDNLLGNAWKFSACKESAQIEFGTLDGESRVYYVRDNGAGFDAANAPALFAPFQRFHAHGEFAGSGVGLATVKRVIDRHGGKIWAQSGVDAGCTFFFTLG